MRIHAFALLAPALLFVAPRARAEEDPSTKAALAATAKVRAAIPEPVEDQGLDAEWTGDLVLGGDAAGSVRLSVDVGEYKGKPVWLSKEVTRREWAGSVVTTTLSAYLARDLSLMRGEWTREEPDRRIHLAFARDEARSGTLKVVREIRTEKGTETAEMALDAAPDATIGDVPLWLFVRSAPKDKGTYLLPFVSLDPAIPAIDEHEPAPDPAPIRAEVLGPSTWSASLPARASFALKFGRTGGERTLHYTNDAAAKDRKPIGVEWARPAGVKVVPKGEGGQKPTYGDDAPATTWRAAFLKFGHGYHMAKRPLLEAACHWPSILAYDRAGGTWGPERGGEAEIREAYVTEWLSRSKHRPQADTDALLAGTLLSATTKTLDDGTVVLTTSPTYGGNIFRLKAIDGVWYIVGVDQ